MSRASSGASAGLTPMRPIPVSTFRWTEAGRFASATTAASASASSREHMASVRPASIAVLISHGNVTPSLRIGSLRPASRSWRPSGTFATPSQSAVPVASAIRETSTAPWP